MNATKTKPDFSAANKKLSLAFAHQDGKTAEGILLNHILPLIHQAGGIPSNQFKRALRAARALDAACREQDNAPQPEGSDFVFTAANGRDFKLFVPKGQDPLKIAAADHIEVISYAKA